MDSNGIKEGYLRISITNKCNFNCFYCSPEVTPGKTNRINPEDFEKILNAASRTDIEKIRITGGEALLHPDFEEILNIVEKFNSISFGITTNGSFLDKYISKIKTAEISRINISLDTINGGRFKKFTGSDDLEKIFKILKRLTDDPFFKIKLNTVVVRGKNLDEIGDFAQLTKELDIEVRFIEYMPVGTQKSKHSDRFVSEKEIREQLDELIFCEHKPGSSARIYKLPDSRGRIGFISPVTRPFCKNCNRLRISSRLKVKGCLKDTEGADLEKYLGDSEKELTEKLIQIFKQKDRCVKAFDGGIQSMPMKEIGG